MLTRRKFFNRISASSTFILAFGSWFTFPLRGLANWNQDAFHSRQYQNALESLYGSKLLEKTSNIKIQAPDVAENGASVPITFSTSIKEIETLSIFIENNPLPLIANYHLKEGMIPEFSMRVKVAKSSNIHVMVQTADKLYSSTRKIQVTLGGCAED